MTEGFGWWGGLGHDALVLFAMVNAVGNLPLFSELSVALPAAERRRAFRTAVLTGGTVVILFAFLGEWMLRSVFQVDPVSFRVAGGILVFAVAARGFLLGARDALPVAEDQRDNLGIFPMGFPLLAGPGTIVTAIILVQSGSPLRATCAAVLVYAACLPVLHLSSLVHRGLGRMGVLLASRILYIFIAAKAVSLVLSGVAESMKGFS